MMPWRRKVMARLERLLPSARIEGIENNLRLVVNWLSKLERRMDDMDADLQAKWDALKDVVKAAESALDSLKKAADYLRSHGGDDTSGLVTEMDSVTKELADKVAAVAASGGPAS